ncbi:hypothetical protein M0R45_037001 [Rubus argutus]|uniref:SKP1 component POZ domain-containing protein n=1 Tax=Rubus argutus TaxID=59490 RepID=A0AAW1W285_RUBAR
MSWNRSKVLRLKSKDDQVLEADENCMRAMSEVIDNTFTMRGTNNYSSENENNLVLLVERVDSKTLAMVIEWCENHALSRHGKCTTPEQLEAWDAEFIKGLNLYLMFDLSWAARCLRIKELRDHMTKTRIEFLTRPKEVVPDLPKIPYELITKYRLRQSNSFLC